jgi:hypothetical protein
MSDPFRLRVLKRLTATIKKVSPLETYVDLYTGEEVPFTNDLRDRPDPDDATLTQEHVFRGRTLFGPSDPLPLVSVLEHPRALDAIEEGQSGGASVGDWDLVIQGFVKDDPKHPTDPAHVLAAEVVAVIMKYGVEPFNILGMGSQQPCVTRLSIGSPVVRPAEDGVSDQAFFWLTVTLTLAEDRERPFA